MPGLRLDAFADIACPWCYVGEYRLRRALSSFRADHPEVDIVHRWRPYQLQPGLPAAGVPWRPFARAKFGSIDNAERAYAHVSAAAGPDGPTFRFDKIQKANNTTDAHRLVIFGRKHGKEWEMVDALFTAYFRHGKDLNDETDLRAVVHRLGLDADAAMDYLASDAGKHEVSESQRIAEQLDIRGVPFLILNQRHAVSGAQPEEAFLRALERVHEMPSVPGSNEPA